MLKLIGAIVIVILIAGPLADDQGLLDDHGPLKDVVRMEIRVFRSAVAGIQELVSPAGPTHR